MDSDCFFSVLFLDKKQQRGLFTLSSDIISLPKQLVFCLFYIFFFHHHCPHRLSADSLSAKINSVLNLTGSKNYTDKIEFLRSVKHKETHLVTFSWTSTRVTVSFREPCPTLAQQHLKSFSQLSDLESETLPNYRCCEGMIRMDSRLQRQPLHMFLSTHNTLPTTHTRIDICMHTLKHTHTHTISGPRHVSTVKAISDPDNWAGHR